MPNNSINCMWPKWMAWYGANTNASPAIQPAAHEPVSSRPSANAAVALNGFASRKITLNASTGLPDGRFGLPRGRKL